MVLPRTFTPRPGLTLIEILVVMGILALIAAFGIIVGIDSYRSYGFRTAQETLLSALQKARSQSLNNINQAPHGVYINSVSHQFTIFQGTSFATRNVLLDVVLAGDASYAVGGTTEVVFAQLNGKPTPTTGDISLASVHICLNSEGQINVKATCP